MPKKISKILSIELTFACNCKCLYCYNQPSAIKEMAPLEKIREYIEIVNREYNISEVRLTGGEATLHPELLEIVAYARQIPELSSVVLLTNGRNLKDKNLCYDLYKAGLTGVQISCHSSNPKVHDYMVGIPGAWQETIQGIRNALEFYPKTSNEYPPISIKPTLTTANIDQGVDTIHFLAELGVRFISPNALVPAGHGIKYLNLIPPREEYLQAYEEMGKVADSLGVYFKASISLNLCKERHFKKSKYILHYSCGKGSGVFNLSPSGDLYVCDTWGKKMGNILQTNSVNAVLNSPLGKFYREGQHLPNKCKVCAQFNECGGICSILYEQNGCDVLFDE